EQHGDDRQRSDDGHSRIDLDDVKIRAELAPDHLQGLTRDDLVEEGAEVRARPRGAQPVEEGDAAEHGQGDEADEPSRGSDRRMCVRSARSTMRPAGTAVVRPNFAPHEGLRDTNTASRPTTTGTAITARLRPRARSQEIARPRKTKRLTMKIAAP